MIETTPPTQGTEIVVPEGVRLARAAFLRDFPALIADRKTREKYVCYHNETMVAVTKTYREMIDELVRRDIPDDASLVVKVTPHAGQEEQDFAEEDELGPA